MTSNLTNANESLDDVINLTTQHDTAKNSISNLQTTLLDIILSLQYLAQPYNHDNQLFDLEDLALIGLSLDLAKIKVDQLQQMLEMQNLDKPSDSHKISEQSPNSKEDYNEKSRQENVRFLLRQAMNLSTKKPK